MDDPSPPRRSAAPKVPPARKIAGMMTAARDHLSKADTIVIAAIEAGSPMLVKARDLIDRFHGMIRKKTEADLVIGVVSGLAFNRYGHSWLARQLTTRQSDLTSVLVGIAGAFIGFHFAIIVGLLPTPLMLYLAATVAALIVLWIWRGR
jgi:uncharacterized membrane protein YeaQ/YmgE (transglycosylase-associated protein family)